MSGENQSWSRRRRANQRMTNKIKRTRSQTDDLCTGFSRKIQYTTDEWWSYTNSWATRVETRLIYAISPDNWTESDHLDQFFVYSSSTTRRSQLSWELNDESLREERSPLIPTVFITFCDFRRIKTWIRITFERPHELLVVSLSIDHLFYDRDPTSNVSARRWLSSCKKKLTTLAQIQTLCPLQSGLSRQSDSLVSDAAEDLFCKSLRVFFYLFILMIDTSLSLDRHL